jgi:YHS domain-containing protein
MTQILTSVAASESASTSALTKNLVNVSGASKVGLSGFDAVSFFTDSKPANGAPSVSAEHKGATYFFATEEHKTTFLADPDKYLPQYGGFCAFGVSVGLLLPIDVPTWQVRNGKLYVVLNSEIKKSFDEEFDANVAKANKNWPDLVKQNN